MKLSSLLFRGGGGGGGVGIIRRSLLSHRPLIRSFASSSNPKNGEQQTCCSNHNHLHSHSHSSHVHTHNHHHKTTDSAVPDAAVARAVGATATAVRPLFSTSAAPIETPIVWSPAAVAAAAASGAAPKHFGPGSQLLRPATTGSVMHHTRAMTTASSALRMPHRLKPPSPLSASSQAQLQQQQSNNNTNKKYPEIDPPVPESEISPNDLSDLVQNNVKWAESMVNDDPLFFKRLENVNAPQYLWLGCSDSRVPANTIIGKLPGEVFVHRNVANCVVHADLNMLSVLQYAVDALRVRHVIVCGHYNCGGVMAAMSNQQYGLVDNWIRHVREVYHNHQGTIDAQPAHKRLDLLCEEHTRAQTENVCRTTIVQNAWARGQPLSVNGFIYRVSDGLLVRLVEPITSIADSRLSAKFRVVPNPTKKDADK